MNRRTNRNMPSDAPKSQNKGIKAKSSIGIPKRKGTSLKTLKKYVWDTFSLFIRLRDCLETTGSLEYGKCITCGNVVPIKSTDAGHFVSRRFNSTLFDETNSHLQCRHCNRYNAGAAIEYRRQIIKLYGEGYDVQLKAKAEKLKKFTADELRGLLDYYKQKVKELEAR